MIGRAPGQRGLWLAYGHAHWGLTLGPATGRLMAEMMTGATPFCDPAPYGRSGSAGDASLYSLMVRTTLDVGRLLTVGSFIVLEDQSRHRRRSS